ncbi:arylsulfatase [Tangfeifania diversioriginum]|uniref:Arylsulfatase n=1 Tax=Tangfeifania diversioriginum TaxID=1168035 RepID=A0A1M6M9U0_9BACT|nr:sulfatase [Tangfeifania diversioriginum]SHJ80063.1 arylsulfatase [Tangfeifania diversioriginum]
MKPISNSFLVFAVFLFFFSCSEQSEQQDKPVNFVLIYLDDMGFGDLTLTGALNYSTPNIDKMAANGMFFSHYYSPQAVCSASRAGLLTGCYPNRVGFSGALDHTADTGINPEEETIAEVLKKKNYATAAFGKWHLGHHKKFLPPNHGFDEYFGIPYSNDMWPNHPTNKNYYPPLPLIEGDEVVETNPDQSRFTTEFTERTVDFIQRNREHPFFVYLAHPMPHVPLFVSDKFKGKSEQGLYGNVMMEIDWSVGEILTALKDLELEENTVVIFTSDNGPWINYGNHAGSTGGLREGKGTTFEGGQRVPFLVQWKGTVEPGRVDNNLVSGIDILPTIAEIAGAQLPEKKIDGVSLLPLLKSPEAEPPRKSFLYYYRRNNLEAVRDGQWKLVFPHNGRTYEGFAPGENGQPGQVDEWSEVEPGLYNLRRDPGERYNLLKHHPEIAERLRGIADAARKDLGDELTDNPGENRRLPGQVE